MASEEFRMVIEGPLMANCGYTQTTAKASIQHKKGREKEFSQIPRLFADLAKRQIAQMARVNERQSIFE